MLAGTACPAGSVGALSLAAGVLLAAARMVRAVALDSGEVMPVCTWVDGQYGISGVYLGVEAEIGATGIRRVVERDLTETGPSKTPPGASAGQDDPATAADLSSGFVVPVPGLLRLCNEN